MKGKGLSSLITLQEALSEDLENSPVKPKVVAAELGQSYSALMNALNPELPKFNFQAKRLARFAQVTGGRRGLNWIADAVGGMFVELPQVPAGFKRIDDLVAQNVKEFGDVLTSIGQALADREITVAEAATLEREIDEQVAKAVALKFEVRRAAQHGGGV
jgi:hypothetical protein